MSDIVLCGLVYALCGLVVVYMMDMSMRKDWRLEYESTKVKAQVLATFILLWPFILLTYGAVHTLLRGDDDE